MLTLKGYVSSFIFAVVSTFFIVAASVAIVVFWAWTLWMAMSALS